MAIFKRGATYWFEFQYDGERVRQSTHQGNAQVARDAEAAERLRRVRGEHGIERKRRAPTLADFAPTFNEWVRSEKSNEGTRNFYATRYQRLLDYSRIRNLRLDEINEDKIEGFKLWTLGRDLSHTTVNKYLTTLRKVLRYAMRKKRLIDRVPVIELYPPTKGRSYVFSDADYQHWLDVCPQPLRAASILARDSGICRGEMLALERDCVSCSIRPMRLDSGERLRFDAA